LRVLVRAAETGRYALRIVPVSVADLSGSDPVLLPPVFVDNLRRSVVVRESTAGVSPDRTARPYPFTIGEKPFVPVVGAALAPDREARICLMAYHLNQEKMLLDAGVVRRDGSQVEGDRLVIRGQSEATGDGLSQLYLSFDPQGLEPGEYTLEVGVTDSETNTTYSESRSFRIAEQGS
ncbi:MAG: hypothetical protein GY856_06995, partial [bacterium]|nr:hypothetical protein [bacterium]